MTTPYKWDRRFLDLACAISTWSKDPSTKVGAVIVDPLRRIVSAGYNGFPVGLGDAQSRLNDRTFKYAVILHGDLNAILFAESRRLKGSTLYTWPLAPCPQCASAAIQVGITRCVFPEATQYIKERWEFGINVTKQILTECGVEWREVG